MRHNVVGDCTIRNLGSCGVTLEGGRRHTGPRLPALPARRGRRRRQRRGPQDPHPERAPHRQLRHPRRRSMDPDLSAGNLPQRRRDDGPQLPHPPHTARGHPAGRQQPPHREEPRSTTSPWTPATSGRSTSGGTGRQRGNVVRNCHLPRHRRRRHGGHGRLQRRLRLRHARRRLPVQERPPGLHGRRRTGQHRRQQHLHRLRSRDPLRRARPHLETAQSTRRNNPSWDLVGKLKRLPYTHGALVDAIPGARQHPGRRPLGPQGQPLRPQHRRRRQAECGSDTRPRTVYR